jgi:hypothetical protein
VLLFHGLRIEPSVGAANSDAALQLQACHRQSAVTYP